MESAPERHTFPGVRTTGTYDLPGERCCILGEKGVSLGRPDERGVSPTLGGCEAVLATP